jgi:membrane protease YdiL (CAAX protease family)
MVNWKRIRDFLLFTFIVNFSLAGIFFTLDKLFGLSDRFSQPLAYLGIIYMLIPATVSFILIKVKYKEKLKDFGLKFHFNGYWALAWILPLLITVCTILVSLLFKFGTLDLDYSAFFENLKVQMGEEAFNQAKEQMEKVGFFLILLIGLVSGTTINAVLAFGEEMGWRGFLFKELKPLGFWKSGIIIGVIWGFWHSPLILMGHNFPEHPYIGVLVMTVACIPLGILIQYVRAKTKTVFSAAVMHGVFNAVSGYAVITVDGGNILLKLTLGISGIVAMGVLVLVLFLVMKVFRGLRVEY